MVGHLLTTCLKLALNTLTIDNDERQNVYSFESPSIARSPIWPSFLELWNHSPDKHMGEGEPMLSSHSLSSKIDPLSIGNLPISLIICQYFT
jgi:hypothetical protein